MSTAQSDGGTGAGGYAGINLPSGNTLNIRGYGTVVATGGKGGDAEAGKSNAKNAHAKKSGNSFQGINGGTGYSATDLSYKYFWAGNDGGAGSSGSTGTSCGTIKKEANITITATAGAGGSNGSGGTCNTETASITSNGEATNYRLEIAMNNKWTCGAGGAGGGGGAGYSGANIGTGGSGGGGGGGGTISCEDSYIFEGGKGGSGSTNGGNGGQNAPYDRYNFKNSDKKTSNETGHGGASGGGAGTSVSVGSL